MAAKAEELVKKLAELEARVSMDEGEARKAAVKPTPARPTQKEIDKHMVTHSLPQKWCPYCV